MLHNKDATAWTLAPLDALMMDFDVPTSAISRDKERNGSPHLAGIPSHLNHVSETMASAKMWKALSFP